MKKKNIINKLIVAPLVMGFMSCTGNYMDINSNPYQPGDLTPDDYALGSAMSNLASTVISSDVNTAQFTDCLLGGPLGGYFADSNAGWSNTISNFNATNDWTRVFLISDRIISTLYGNLSTVKQVSENTNNPVPYAIAQIIKVAAMSRVTDAYGPIPYSKIGQDGKITIPYDTQEEVYNAFFKELDESIEVLTENRNAALVASADFVYSGNVQKWVKFANTLRLRLALRVSNVDPALAQTQAKAALTDPAGLMQSQDDNMKQTPKRQYIAGGNENIYALLFSWTGNAVLSKEMERAYKNQALKEGAAADAVTFNENSENCYLDPRCEVLWFRPTPFDSLTTSPLPTENLKRDFNGVMNGETNVGGSYLNRYSANRCILSSDAMNKDYWWNLAREIVWMGYAESLFLKAEAALRWPSLVDETAEALYLKGIKASMDYYEIDADKANEYISHLDGVKAFAGGSKEEQLEQIITQKWIAVFPNGNEGWAEVRRTDYPRYLLAPVNGNNSNGEVASGKLIKRINYPNSESRNPNKPGNVNQGSRVWWDVTDTMNDRGQWHTPNNFR